IGHRRLAAAPPIARRSRLAARAPRADRDLAQRIGARDRAAARTDLDHLGDRDAQRQAAALEVAPDARHLEAARLLGPALRDEADLRRGAAHVEREHLLLARV